MNRNSLIITSIANDKHPVLNQYAVKCKDQGIRFIVIGDTKSPDQFEIDGCEFYSVKQQQQLNFKLASIAPVKHYSRKNIGYLIAMKDGCNTITETDDDNYPFDEFWVPATQQVKATAVNDKGWINVYSHFSEKMIWPRGYPLELILNPAENLNELPVITCNCPVQQGLADENPDVDAVYRLTYPLPFRFQKNKPLALGHQSWSPFNSQNTVWFKDAFPLMYLPTYCSFRMTDIWRSFVVQRVAWEFDWHILYHSATVWQERNDHSLLTDFKDEIPGYLNNSTIAKELEKLTLSKATGSIYDNLVACYDCLISLKLIDPSEKALLQAWCDDIKSILS